MNDRNEHRKQNVVILTNFMNNTTNIYAIWGYINAFANTENKYLLIKNGMDNSG